MSSDPVDPGRGETAPDGADRGPDPHRLRPTQPGPLTVLVVVGLLLGWLLRPLGHAWLDSSPSVGWSQVGVVGFVLATLAWLVRDTRRAFARGAEGLPAHRAVNRWVMARACAHGGALLLGGYLGHAVSWLGIGSEPATGHVLRALVAAALACGTLLTALLLERACRTGSGADRP